MRFQHSWAVYVYENYPQKREGQLALALNLFTHLATELEQLTTAIADWAAAVPTVTIYVYGSRVRGHHRPNSDVDLHIGPPTEITRDVVEWWTAENPKDFVDLRRMLPG